MMPSFAGILKARKIVYKYLYKTPLILYPGLSKLLGAEVYVKHENHHQIGAFKVRGGINLISQTTDEEKRKGVICATRGNHGQSVAFAAKKFGLKATIVVPIGNNPDKNSSIKDLGADLIEYGKDFDEAKIKVEELINQYGYRYIKTGDEPKLIEGVGTYAFEIFEELPEPDFIFVPIGLGSGICGNIIVADALNSPVEIIGCQAKEAPAVGNSVLSKNIVKTNKANTIADGLATRAPELLPLEIMRRRIKEIEFISEDEIEEGIKLFLKLTHNLCEGAAATTIISALKLKSKIYRKKVVLVMTGANLDTETLRKVLVSDEAIA